MVAFIAAGVVLRLLPWTIGFLIAPIFGSPVWRPGTAGALEQQFRRAGATFIAAAVTGVLSGLLFWWLATTIFPLMADVASQCFPDQTCDTPVDRVVFVTFAPPILLLATLLIEALFIGVVSRWTDDEEREWWSRVGAWLLIAGLFWMSLRLLALFGPLAIHWLEAKAPVIITSLGGISGLLTAALGFGAKSAGPSQKQGPKGPLALLRGLVLTLAASVFICAFLAGLSLGGDWLLHYLVSHGAPSGVDCNSAVQANDSAIWWYSCGTPAARLMQSVGLFWILVAIGVLSVWALVFQWLINVNRFSLHALYRNRLIRAYLGASHAKRWPNWFTGFDPDDNMHMTNIKTGGAGDIHRPFHILNASLNLVHGSNLAWQQRMAEPMSFSALHCGNQNLEFRRSEKYGSINGISLGTALTLSGAAASPNMGYHSSPIVGLVMTLFNVRLGGWLGNPGPAGDGSVASECPPFSGLYLMYEALGLTNDQKEFVYLSDGGHFEDLALYQMIVRRCKLIVVSDADCDPGFEFEDLGNAIRKIRIDLGVNIVMDEFHMHPRQDVGPDGNEMIAEGQHWVTGTIHYPETVNGQKCEGRLIYIKPGIYGHEPNDVLNYAAQHPDFPHETTADQWFNESQFESYRALGEFVAGEIIHLIGGGTHAATPSGITAFAAQAAQRPRADSISRRRPQGWFGR
jgi:hypothetical protein